MPMWRAPLQRGLRLKSEEAYASAVRRAPQGHHSTVIKPLKSSFSIPNTLLLHFLSIFFFQKLISFLKMTDKSLKLLQPILKSLNGES